MSQRSSYHATRLTHVPTGISVQTSRWFPSPSMAEVARRQMAFCRSLLAAKLCRDQPEPPDPAFATTALRTYHLNPPLGIEPFIGHGRGHGREIAVGADAVQRVLRGEIPLPIRPKEAAK